jgi:hypothetical protein
MIHFVLVAVGAVAGAMAFMVAWQRRWDWRRILAFNVAVSALAGAVAGALDFVSQENVVSSFLSYGVLGTAAPFASLLLPTSAPRDASDAWDVIRRTAGILVISTLFCATAASATYMVIAGSFFYVRATH